ncbi:hypothetical protein B0J13DRAFT_534415 [Dactylonectria estremocensis]|uniref:Uncharacterized protein n=1 Tax=Dactylonectria estremocensis TaxID=1079267 RepID=A0A9P9D212_9HYPO|nr:hypothetical protein B0J13DRAFT_534415 [Dactylonectria estremocensis]
MYEREPEINMWELACLIVTSSASKTHSEIEKSMVPGRLPVRETIDALSPKYSHNVIGSTRSIVNKGEVPVLFVMDDDPTGTQTYHDIDVLTMWDIEILQQEFALNPQRLLHRDKLLNSSLS